MEAQWQQQHNAFVQQVILPGLELVQQYCEHQDCTCWLVTRRPTGDEAFDQVLAQLPPPSKAQWWIATLRVQQYQLPSSSADFARYAQLKRPFYLTVEGIAPEKSSFCGLASVFYPRSEPLEGTSLDASQPQPPAESFRFEQPFELLNYFIEHFEVFNAEASPAPQRSVSTASQTIAPSSSPQPVTEAPPTAEPTLKLQRDYTKLKAAIVTRQAAQQQAADEFTTFLNLQSLSARTLADFESGARLAQKVLRNRPAQGAEGDDPQQAYDALIQQAKVFALSLSPLALNEFAVYFEIYWTMAVGEEGLDPVALSNQVQALGRPQDWAQVREEVAQPLRTLVRSLVQKVGERDAMNRPMWMSSAQVNLGWSADELVQSIQALTQSQQFLFGELFWGVLQVYQNAGGVPRSEAQLGRNAVLRYIRSARLTIEQPTEPVVCESDEDEYWVFRFVRQIGAGPSGTRGVAMVRVSQLDGEVVLYTYRFELQI